MQFKFRYPHVTAWQCMHTPVKIKSFFYPSITQICIGFICQLCRDALTYYGWIMNACACAGSFTYMPKEEFYG